MDIVKIEENKNNVIVKHKDLIWEARYRLSELGIKVMSVLISMIRVNDDDFQQYALKVSDFKELIGSDSKNTYDYTHRLIKELLSKTLRIKDEQFAWISYGKYVEGSDVMIFEINRHLKPYLIELKSNFLEYSIVNIMPLRSSYVIRLYELFKSKWNEYKHYNRASKNYTFELKIDWLKEHFEIPTSYRYNDIKRVVEKAKKQLKEKTDIQFIYKEQKIGRKVDRLIITIRDNNKGSNDYLRDRHTYINWARKNFSPDPINNKFPKILEVGTLKIAIDLSGRLYIATDGEPKYLDNKEADLLWTLLYKLEKKEITQEELIESFFTEYQEHIQQEQNNSYDNIDFTQFYGRSIVINDQLFHNIILINQLDRNLLEVVFVDNSRVKIVKDLFLKSLVIR